MKRLIKWERARNRLAIFGTAIGIAFAVFDPSTKKDEEYEYVYQLDESFDGNDHPFKYIELSHPDMTEEEE